jgi:hypothetical protein
MYCVIVSPMDADFHRSTKSSFASQLGTSLILGTNGVKNPVIYMGLVGAVGIEPTTFKS